MPFQKNIKKLNKEIRSNKEKICIIVLIIGLLFLIFLLLTHNTQAKTDEDWKDDFINEDKIKSMNNVSIYDGNVEIIKEWSKRKTITISNSDSTLSDYQIKINVDYDSDMKSDFSDLRFLDSEEKIELNYWIEEYTPSLNATIWLKIPNIPIGDSTIDMDYGHKDAYSFTSFDNTFTKDYDEDGLVGLWHMDEGCGVTIKDSSGNGNTGTFGGDPSWNGSDGGYWNSRNNVKFSNGDSLNFDGNNDYVNCGSANTLEITGSYTLTVWTKIFSLTDRGTIIGFGSSGETESANLLYRITPMLNGDIRIGHEYGAGNDQLYDINADLTTNIWYYFTLVKDSTGKEFKLYINSILIDTVSYTNEATGGSSGRLWIGRNPAPDDKYFNGLIDEVRIYNLPLKAEEINAHYERRRYASQEPSINIDLEETMSNWYNSNWERRRAITISNEGNELTDYQVKINVTYESDMQIDFDDIRFTGIYGKTELSYWIEDYSESNFANVWVKIPLIPKNGAVIYMYYGNPSVGSTLSFDNTFTKDYEEKGLVGLWHMDEGSGTTILDSSGYGNTGTFNGGDPNWVGSDGGQWNSRENIKFSSGNCLYFDGVDNYISIGNVAGTPTEDSYSISLWVMVNNFDGGSSHKLYSGEQKGQESTGIYATSSGTFIFNTWDGNADTIETGTLSTGVWYHVVAVHNANGKKELFVNGTLIGTKTSGDLVNNAPEWYIGSGDIDDGGKPFDGIIDEVRIYNRVLKGEEINAQYERRKYALIEPTINIGDEEEYYKEGYLISKEINPPKNCILSKLNNDKIEPSNTKIKITILDGNTNNLIPGFENLEANEIDISSIDTTEHSSLKLKGEFMGNEDETPLLHSWSISWKLIPIAKLTASSVNAYIDEDITFDTSNSIDDDGIILRYKFDFGDGTIIDWTAQRIITYRYQKVGNYSAKLKVRDNDGLESEWSQEINITIKNRAPIAVIDKPKNNQEFIINKEIEFNASSSYDNDGDELTFKWESNIDGVLYEGKNSSFITKLSKGKHTITLTVLDVNGGKNEIQIVIIVNEETTSEKIKSSIISSLFIGIIGCIIVVVGIVLFIYKQRSGKSSELLQPTTQQTMSNIGYGSQTSPQYQQDLYWEQQPRVEPKRDFGTKAPEEITIKCPVCNNMINVVSTGQPLEIKCPYCGAEGTVKM